jgi:G:T-mismatch repair DNA endonuclease (very short patch repair protein)
MRREALPDHVIDKIQFVALRYACFWHKADMAVVLNDVRVWG